jgi:hypothetical protein
MGIKRTEKKMVGKEERGGVQPLGRLQRRVVVVVVVLAVVVVVDVAARRRMGAN